MGLREIQGDLFTSDAQAIAHGVNTHGVMGSGIALQFARKFPVMKREYERFCKSQFEFTGGDMLVWRDGGTTVYNLATQEKPGRNASLLFAARAFDKMFSHACCHQIQTIAIPRIGAGIGGLEWSAVREVIEATPAFQHWTEDRKGELTVFFR